MFCASQLFAHSFSRFFRIRMRFFLQFFLARFALVTLFSSIFYYFAFTSPLFYYSISAIFAAFTTIGPMMMMMDFFRQKLSVSGTWSRYWNLLIVSAHFNETFLFNFSVFGPLAQNASQGGATVEPRFFFFSFLRWAKDVQLENLVDVKDFSTSFLCFNRVFPLHARKSKWFVKW